MGILAIKTPGIGGVQKGLGQCGSHRIPKWKRQLDWGLLLATCPLWGGAFLVCALWIKLVSRGPLFYVQQRVGLDGHTFPIFKFRSMKFGGGTAVHEDHLSQLIDSDKPMTKLDATDPRLILGGKLLRASGLDELPQLLNVIRGEMSLVGPRPCTPCELKKFKACYLKRFNGVPGLTGLWQVSGKNRTCFRQMVALDILYVHKMSPWVDFFVLLKTIPAILLQLWDSLHSTDPEAWVARRKARRNAKREARREAGRRSGARRSTSTSRDNRSARQSKPQPVHHKV